MSKLSLSSLHDSREIKLRNIIALEQCHYPKHTHVCSYALFLDYLIDTDKDVDLLLEKGNSFLLILYQYTYKTCALNDLWWFLV